jgi:NAD(P)-dependent dehydrogenase (short-subunit alcohol dehydrogenase family)
MTNWLITGASRGLGAAIAAAALDAGHRVAGTLRQAGQCDAFRATAPGRAHAYVLDVTDRLESRRVMEAAWSDLGGIDVFVNNAGFGLAGAVEEASEGEIRQLFEVNVLAPLGLLRALLPQMRARRRGHLIMMSSVSGLVGWPALGLYSGTKFAVEGIFETLAQEVAPLGIKVTLIEPGGFRTDFSGDSMMESPRRIADYDATAGRNRQILKDHHGHQPGDPAKLAAAILAVVNAERPPKRLLLGRDALSYVEAKWTEVEEERSCFAELSTSTDFG